VKKIALSGILTLGLALAAHAQVVVSGPSVTQSYSRQSTYTGTGLPGHGWGYGTRYQDYYGCSRWGYPYWGYGGGYYSTAVAPGVAAGMWHPGGPYVTGVDYGPGIEPYGGGYGPLPYRPVVARAERVAERSPENVAAVAVEAGRRRIRAGDYRGAVAATREAIVADGDVATHEAWFAVALALAGETRPADKALRAGLKHGFKGTLDLQMRDAKEAARVGALLAQAGGEAAAYALSLLGQPQALQALAAKDPALKPLLP
jgi:hypothetical protein